MGKEIVDYHGELIKTGFYRGINCPEYVCYIDLDNSRIIQSKGAYSLDSLVCSLIVPLNVDQFVTQYKEILAFIKRREYHNTKLFKIIKIQDYPSKQQEKLKEDFYALSDHLDNLDEKDPSPDNRA